MTLVLTVLLLFLCVGSLPLAPWGGWHSYGYVPSGVSGIVVIVLVVLLLTGRP